MENGEYLIAKSIQAVRDGAAIMSAVIDEGSTWIKLIPIGSLEDFEEYWEGLDDDVCD